MRNGDQLDALIEHVLQSADVKLSMFIVWNEIEFNPIAFDLLTVRNHVTSIFRNGGQDAVAGVESEGVEGHVPCASGVLGVSNLIW